MHFAFMACTHLTNITIPDCVHTIGQAAFADCWALTSITIPVFWLEERAFMDCKSLTNVIIGDSVRKIEVNTFYGCYALTSVTIGDSVQSIHSDAFHLCDSITSVYCKPSTPPKLSNDYMFFGATIYVPKGRLEAYESDKYWSRYTKIEEYDF